MSLDDKSGIASDRVEPVDDGPPRLLDTSVTDDDPAAGRDGRDLLDPKKMRPIRSNASGARVCGVTKAAAIPGKKAAVYPGKKAAVYPGK